MNYNEISIICNEMYSQDTISDEAMKQGSSKNSKQN